MSKARSRRIQQRWWNRVLSRIGIHGHTRGGLPAALENLEPRTLFSIIPLGAPVQIDNGVPPITLASQIATDAAGDRVVVWATSTNGTTFDGNLFFKLLDVNGVPLTAQTLVNATPATNTLSAGGGLQAAKVGAQAADFFDVAMDPGGDFVVVWQASNGIFAQRFTPAGATNGTRIMVSDSTSSNNVSAPSVAMDTAGDFAVSWLSDEIVPVDVKSMTPSHSNQYLDPNNHVKTASTPATSVIQPVNYTSAVVFSRRFDITGTGEATVRVSPFGPGLPVNGASTAFTNNISPSISMDTAGDFVVAWDAVGYGVQKLTSNPGYTHETSTYVGAGHFVNLKTTQGPTSTYYMTPKSSTLEFQRFDAQSVPAGTVINAISKTAKLTSVDAQVSEDPAGDFAVVGNFAYDKSIVKKDANGNSYTVDQTSSAVRFKRFKAGGKTASGEVLAVSHSAIPGAEAPIESLATAMSHDGTLLVAWDQTQYDNVAKVATRQGVFTQRFTTAGKALDVPSMAVAAPTAKNALAIPSVAFSGDTVDMSYRGGPLDLFVQEFRQPMPDLTGSLPPLISIANRVATQETVPLTITNSGEFLASGTVTVALDFSTDNVFGNSDDVPITLKTSTFHINLAPGKSTTIRLTAFLPAGLPIGPNFLIAHITAGPTIVESNIANNDAVTNLILTGGI